MTTDRVRLAKAEGYGPSVDALPLVQSIPGWLRPEDASIIYDLARASDGPILEIGTYCGKSTILMALAVRDAGGGQLVYSVDVDLVTQRTAMAEARSRGLEQRILFVHGTVAAFHRAYPHVGPSLTFVDGDHSRDGVRRDLAVLEQLVPAGGAMLFHDYADPRNEDEACADICVRPTVAESWVADQCDFKGEFGCCGLFIRRHAPTGDRVLAVDLLRLEGLGEQYRYRWRRPVARLLSGVRGTRTRGS